MDAISTLPRPVNEPILDYTPGSPERAGIEAALKDLGSQTTELTMTIAGKQRMAGGEAINVLSPQRHSHVLGCTANAVASDVQAAIDGALAAAPMWRELPFEERASVFLRAADLLSGPWRPRLNAATMLGQSKTVIQAEIDAACELIDFLRFNVSFAHEILGGQPQSAKGVWNRSDYRPLEGFVLAITPFNFTAIAGNLPTAPALMGNTVIWKPSPTQQLSAHFTMRLLEAAGLPPGVINLVTGDGTAISEVALTHRDLAGIHFTGSTPTFQHLWRTVGNAIDQYRSYPRLVGETGGKDFVIAHPGADAAGLVTALVRGAFEYQGQKCSAASRAYVPRSLWEAGVRDELADVTGSLTYGDPADFTNFGGAVIDRRSYDRLSGVLEMAGTDPALAVLAGGSADDSEGFFIRPTVVTSDDPTHEVFTKEYFGPFLAVHVYADADYDGVVDQAADIAPYALTGSIFATDRRVIEDALHRLRFS
ncbi:MAG: L-glutamate gamma-semialdehyde dehydrogenase, partial [Geodermatophilaceae bacterium]